MNKKQTDLTSKEELIIKISGLITSARTHAGFSQKELAQKIGTQQPGVARAEGGEIIASIEFLDKIARAIGTELVIYFGFMKEDYDKAFKAGKEEQRAKCDLHNSEEIMQDIFTRAFAKGKAIGMLKGKLQERQLLIEKIQKLDTSGGGNGRRLQIQLLDMLKE